MIERGSYSRTEAIPPWGQIARQTLLRSWPPPRGPWLVAQTWENLLFAHWPVAPSALRPLIPSGLSLDMFAGEAWVGVVPFRLSHLAPRGAAGRVGLGFPELNVRTYVTIEDKPGVWFFSLDAASILAVIGARAAYHLPYFWAAMDIGEDGEWITYRSQRRFRAAARFVGRYRPIGPVCESAPESLERWLTARYCLYARDRSGHLFRAEINHPPWPLQVATAEIRENTMAAAHGISLAGSPLLHFSRRVDMVTWWPKRIR
jgi:uncharacterized protein